MCRIFITRRLSQQVITSIQYQGVTFGVSVMLNSERARAYKAQKYARHVESPENEIIILFDLYRNTNVKGQINCFRLSMLSNYKHGTKNTSKIDTKYSLPTTRSQRMPLSLFSTTFVKNLPFYYLLSTSGKPCLLEN